MGSRKRIEELEKLVAENPKDVRLLLELAAAYQRAGDLPKAAHRH